MLLRPQTMRNANLENSSELNSEFKISRIPKLIL